MTTVEILKFDPTDHAALYRWYDGETEPQPAHIELDLETGRFDADYNGEIGEAMPASVWHGRTVRWRIPLLTGDAANTLLDELKPLAQRVLDGADIQWDGNNNVGVLDESAQDAQEEIARTVDDIERLDYAHVEYGQAYDYLSGQNSSELGITAYTTNDQLTAMADKIQADAEPETPGGYVVIEGIEEYLEKVRAELRTELRDELEEVAARAAAATVRRDDLIRTLASWKDDEGKRTDSDRSIAERAGLSHTAIQRIRNIQPESETE